MTRNAGQNIWYSTIGGILSSALTLGFWIIAAGLTTTATIGLASTITSFVLILATIDVLNMPIGMKRSMGIAFTSNETRSVRKLLRLVLFSVSISVAITAIVVGTPVFGVTDFLDVPWQYVLIMVVMLYSMALQQIFTEALTVLMRSKETVMPILVGSMIRIPILLGMIAFSGDSDLGVLIAYSSMLITSTPILALNLARALRSNTQTDADNNDVSIRELLNSSLAGWIPQVIKVLGSQLGVVTIFAVAGALEAARFYIPMSIFLVALFVVSGINRVSHSLIAGLNEAKDQNFYATYFTRIAFVFTLPLTTPLVFFAKDFLALIGQGFSSSDQALIILILSMPAVIVAEMIYYFTYGKGDNRRVLYLGMVGNVPRTILYFILVPVLGVNGAALAYVLGSVAQVLLSVKVARYYSIPMQYKEYILLTLIPLAIGFPLWLSSLNFVVSSVIVVMGSVLLYTRLGLLTDNDVQNVVFAGLPHNSAVRISPTLSVLIQKIKQI